MAKKSLLDQKRPDIFTRLCGVIESYPVPIGGFVIAVFITPMAVPDKQQQRQSIAFLVGTLIVGLTAYLYIDGRRKRQSTTDDSLRPASARTTKAQKSRLSTPTTTATSSRLKSIWEAGKSGGTNNNGKHQNKGKPFGSKYYYAHNNPNATGGYKDGLKMEDYQMNGPRLLSKNGKSAMDLNEDAQPNHDATDKDAAIPPSGDTPKGNPTNAALDPSVRMITKYLWDDPGDSNGIATIRIDVLPGRITGEYIDCKDVQIGAVEAKLAGEGLLVKVDAEHAGRSNTYQLKITKLYGDAADVKVVVKSKRLLVKIHKKMDSVLGVNKKQSNLDAWPQPHRKV